MGVAHVSSPFITVYRTSDWTMIDIDPSDLPGNSGLAAAFSVDGTIMAVGHAPLPNLNLYNIVNGDEISKMDIPVDLNASVNDIAFSPTLLS